MKEILLTFLISMVPVLELRGAIPFGIAEGVDTFTCLVVAIIGNIIPVPFIILFIRKVFAWMKKKSKVLAKFVEKLEAKAEKEKEKVIAYEFFGLMLLVAIPIPGTGAWTGAMVAAMLNMRLKNAFPAIAIGVVIAGLLVTLASYGIISLF